MSDQKLFSRGIFNRKDQRSKIPVRKYKQNSAVWVGERASKNAVVDLDLLGNLTSVMTKTFADDSSVMADKAKKKARGNYCVAVVPIWLIVKIIRWLREFQCITSRKTELYGRNGLCLSEFIGKISSHRNQRRYALYTSTKSVSKASLFRSRLPKLVRLFSRRGTWLKGSVPTRYAVVPHSSPITSRKRRRVSKNTVRISWVFYYNYNKLICFDCMKLLQFDSAHWSPCVYCIALS